MPGIYRDGEDKRRREARNGAIQFLAVLHYAEEWNAETRLSPDLIRELQRIAITQIYTCAGSFRTGPVRISGVKHQPPDHTEVGGLVQEMCDYVTGNWAATPIHLAAYLMWRLNWIHPFFGGNGRTARAVSYLILCAKLGFRLPGEETIPDLIVADRAPYYAALQSADTAWEAGAVDVSDMEDLMSSLLAKQLLAVHRQATGQAQPDTTPAS